MLECKSNWNCESKVDKERILKSLQCEFHPCLKLITEKQLYIKRHVCSMRVYLLHVCVREHKQPPAVFFSVHWVALLWCCQHWAGSHMYQQMGTDKCQKVCVHVMAEAELLSSVESSCLVSHSIWTLGEALKCFCIETLMCDGAAASLMECSVKLLQVSSDASRIHDFVWSLFSV